MTPLAGLYQLLNMGQTLSTLVHGTENDYGSNWKRKEHVGPSLRLRNTYSHWLQMYEVLGIGGSDLLIGFLAMGYEPMPSLINSDVSGGTY